MSEHVFRTVEVLNRLKRGTQEGRVLWARDSTANSRYIVALENGHSATIACPPPAAAVHFSLSSPDGLETIRIDSSNVAEDLVRLALLQLYVTVRDSCALRAAEAALDAVRDL